MRAPLDVDAANLNSPCCSEVSKADHGRCREVVTWIWRFGRALDIDSAFVSTHARIHACILAAVLRNMPTCLHAYKSLSNKYKYAHTFLHMCTHVCVEGMLFVKTRIPRSSQAHSCI